MIKKSISVFMFPSVIRSAVFFTDFDYQFILKLPTFKSGNIQPDFSSFL